jgi:hypothetical protein
MIRHRTKGPLKSANGELEWGIQARYLLRVKILESWSERQIRRQLFLPRRNRSFVDLEVT